LKFDCFLQCQTFLNGVDGHLHFLCCSLRKIISIPTSKKD
jgi:hypothetical protein